MVTRKDYHSDDKGSALAAPAIRAARRAICVIPKMVKTTLELPSGNVGSSSNYLSCRGSWCGYMSLLDGKTQSNCTAIPWPIARTRSSTTSAPCTDAVSGPGVVAGSPARYSSSWRITRAHSFFPVLLSAIFLAAVRSAKRLPLVQVSLISSDGK